MNNIRILDGGMGRELDRMGAPFKQPEWSALSLMEAPHFVEQAHLNFIDAGAEIITTNAYAIVPYHIGKERFNADGRKLIRLSAELACAAAKDKPVLVAGCIPPLFGSYKPENFDKDKVDEIISPLIEEQIDLVDLWLIETTSSLEEAVTAYNHLKNTEKPIWLSLTVPHMEDHDQPPILRSGEDLATTLNEIKKMNLDALLFNCCRPEEVEPVLKVTRSVLPNMTLGAYPNNFANAKKMLSSNEEITAMRKETTPQAYVDMAQKWVDAGATILGGCCGIGPEYIKALSDEFK